VLGDRISTTVEADTYQIAVEPGIIPAPGQTVQGLTGL
jgi:hypothetical protein